jgi:GntR family transcriptional regulator, transcriptional repressor for pyruvate dehydrogenase complex
MMIRPARRKSLYEEITNQILGLISEGKWKENERIPGEIELSELFEVSRNSMREAIKALSLIGILRARSGSGTFVAENAVARVGQFKNSSLQEKDTSILEIMEARLIMEPSIVRIATVRATTEDFTKLQEILDSCFRAVRDKNYDFTLGFSFHYTLFQIAGNRILIEVVNTLKEKLVGVRRDIFLKHIDEKVFLDELNEHQQILSLMKVGNADEAARVMEQHISVSLQNIRNRDSNTRIRSLVQEDN